jgi:hypothetical protein
MLKCCACGDTRGFYPSSRRALMSQCDASRRLIHERMIISSISYGALLVFSLVFIHTLCVLHDWKKTNRFKIGSVCRNVTSVESRRTLTQNVSLPQRACNCMTPLVGVVLTTATVDAVNGIVTACKQPTYVVAINTIASCFVCILLARSRARYVYYSQSRSQVVSLNVLC